MRIPIPSHRKFIVYLTGPIENLEICAIENATLICICIYLTVLTQSWGHLAYVNSEAVVRLYLKSETTAEQYN